MAKVRFYLKTAQKSIEKSIFMNFENKGEKFTYFLDDKISPQIWDQKNQKFLSTTKETIEIESRMNYFKSMVMKAYSSLITYSDQGKTILPSIEAIQTQFLINIGQEKFSALEIEERKKRSIKEGEKKKEEDYKNKITLPELFPGYVAAKGLKKGTKKIFNRVQSNLIDFSQKRGVSLLLNHLNMEFFDRFKNFLIQKKEEGGLYLVNESANVILKKIKAVVRYYEDDYDHMNTKCLKGKYWSFEQQPVFNTYDEIGKFKSFDFKKAIIDTLNMPENDDSERDNWTTKELSYIMDITPGQIYSLAKHSGMPVEHKGKGRCDGFRFKKKDVLNWLMSRDKMQPTIYSLERARDFYCFACYVPLRYEDFTSITNDHIFEKKDDADNPVKILKFRAQKNNVLVEAPLNSYCLSIIEKYKGQSNNGKLFPVPSDNNLNKALHRAMKLSGLFNEMYSIAEYRGNYTIDVLYPKWEVITFHSARHTFGTNMIAMNVPISYVREILGHKDQKTTEIYTHIIKEKLSSTILQAINQEFKPNLKIATQAA